LFSGDLGRSNDPLIPAPENPESADFLVVESTYGDRVHPKTNPMLELRDLIMRTIDRGGIILIPSFAVGRAQLVLYFLRELKRMKLIPDIPIFLNSPMAKTVNEVFVHHIDGNQFNQAEAKAICEVARIVSSVEESIALNQDRAPKIIIAASGMASGGRVLHHLKVIAPDHKNTIVFVGYQAAGTRGEALVNGADEIKIHGEFWPVKAEVANLDSLSAHADSDEILKWIGKMPERPKHIFVTHGEHAAAETLKRRIMAELETEASVPEFMSVVDL
jgi:metallo-beta-lactamase family protein